MKISSYRLGFLGFGHMAQVIYEAIDHAKLIPRSQIHFLQRDPHKMRNNAQKYGLTSTSLEHLVEASDLLVLGVRPEQAGIVLAKLVELKCEKPIVSILAGVKIDYFKKYLPKAPIVRVMPNLASAVLEGMSVITPSSDCSSELKSAALLLFGCMGKVLELPESLTDIACGIAGSGPGFVFRLIEAMARTGEKEGVRYEDALQMSAQVFFGAARLILKGGNPETLMQQITVPNGTTAAGFDVMRKAHIAQHLQETVLAAARRSRELSET